MSSVNIPFNDPYEIYANISSYSPLPGYNYNPNNIVRDSQDNFYALVLRNSDYSRVSVHKSSDYGATWTNTNAPESYSSVSEGGSICVNPVNDEVTIFFEVYSGGDANVYTSTYNGTSWTARTSIIDNSWSFSSCYDENGNLHIVYWDGDNASVKHKYKLYGESSWNTNDVYSLAGTSYSFGIRLVYSTHDQKLHVVFCGRKFSPTTYTMLHCSYNGSWSSPTTLYSGSDPIAYHILYFNEALVDKNFNDEGLVLAYATAYTYSSIYTAIFNNNAWQSPVLFENNIQIIGLGCRVDFDGKFYLSCISLQNDIYWYNIWSKYSSDGLSTWSNWIQTTFCSDDNEYDVYWFALLPFDRATIPPSIFILRTEDDPSDIYSVWFTGEYEIGISPHTFRNPMRYLSDSETWKRVRKLKYYKDDEFHKNTNIKFLPGSDWRNVNI